MLVKNDLFDYENRYIYQDSEYFKFSLDSILIAEYTKTKPGDVILDMCAGNMAIPLILSTYYSGEIHAFEIQDKVFELGKKSIELNNLGNQIKVYNDDVKNLNKYFKSDFFDIMVCNPPFFKCENTKMINDNKEKSLARHEIAITLEDIFQLAKSYLKNKGELYIVHRAERLDELLYLGIIHNVGVKEVQLVTTKVGSSPSTVLVKCVKNARWGVKIRQELCVENLKSYKNIFKEQ